MDSPLTRPVQMPEQGHVVSFPQVGGLHRGGGFLPSSRRHRYERRAAWPTHGMSLVHFALFPQAEKWLAICKSALALPKSKSTMDFTAQNIWLGSRLP
jgi:hypothetical protein